jgi:hypothetical protein
VAARAISARATRSSGIGERANPGRRSAMKRFCVLAIVAGTVAGGNLVVSATTASVVVRYDIFTGGCGDF